MQRRLAAILAADVVGYSALIGADEAGTLARLMALRAEVLEPALAEHDGRLFKTMGDGFLAEFSSAVQALSCALAVQKRLAEAADGLRLRIGLHAGDVVVEGDDLLGDGVNVAARIQPLAEPGGIALSARVREDAQGRLEISAEDAGEQSLRNIARSVRVFRIAPPGAAAAPAAPVLALPDKPSIAVLPFANMSGDAEQEYFADGVAEDIITELSRSRTLFIIARNSSFTYRGKSVDIRQVGRELGVRYVLEGSVRRGGDRIRVTAQLIEAATGTHLWAERYDRNLTDVFAIQDEITTAVTISVGIALADIEQQRALRKPPAELDAWSAYQQGMWYLVRGDADGPRKAVELFAKAMEIDPQFAAAHARRAMMGVRSQIFFGVIPSAREIELRAAWARRAVELDPDDAVTHCALCLVCYAIGEMDGALASAREAVRINANSAEAHSFLGTVLAFTGHTVEARASLEQSRRLNPRDWRRGIRVANIAASFYFEHDYESAAHVARLGLLADPEHPFLLRWLTAALGQLGRAEEAREALQRALTVSPDSFAFHVSHRPPWFRPVDYDHMLEGLRKAGWDG